jgi:GH24 family phage-related lysozyme (muramidase)
MVNVNRKAPGNVLTFQGEGQISGSVPSAAVYQGQGWEALAGVAGGLSERLGKLADEAAAREGELAGLTAGQQSGASYLQSNALTTEAAATAGRGPWIEQAKAILRKEEGFRANPYWDTNAHRVGYGSDTTVVNGKSVRVSKDMTITRDMAEADLTNRLLNREGAQVQRQLGATWDILPDSAKAALASVGYNYGSLPKAVVMAAKTGDLQTLAAAVRALPANAKRRAREADIIAGSAGAPATKVASAAPASAPGTMPDGAPPATLPTLPLALRRDGTIRGGAYDNAAASAYAWRMQEGLSNDLSAAHQQFQNDPQGFAGAMADIHAKYVADPNLSDPYMRESFDKSFAQRSDAYAQDVAARHQTQLRAEQEASFASGLEASRVDLQRQAQVMGANPNGDELIGKQVATLAASIDGAVHSGTITPAAGEKFKSQIAETAARGRIQGVYDALPTPRAQQQYSLSILEDWKSGKGPLAKLDYETVQALSDTLRRDAQEKINKQQAANSADRVKIETLVQDDIASIQATGKPLDTASGLTPETVQAATGDAGLAIWQQERIKAGKIYDATNGMETQSAADIAQRLELIRKNLDLTNPKEARAGLTADQEVYAAAAKRAGEILKEREKDPLGQAARAGAVELQNIDASDPAKLIDSLKARRDARLQVSGLYGQPAPFFRPGEKEALAATLASNPAAISSFAASIGQVMGSKAQDVLAEISPDAPVLAHAAGLTLATGSNAVADEVASTLAMKRDKLLTAKMPPEGDLGNFAGQTLGNAMIADPKARGALVQTANILFERMANTYGFDATDIKTEGSAAQVAYAQALDRAAGGHSIGGVAYGGISQINGSEVVVPPDMKKDEPQQLVSNLSDEQLAFLPPFKSGDYPLTARDIRNATLVSAGNGRYFVATGDPQSLEPKWVVKPNGTRWSLDIHALKDLATTSPSGNGFGNINPYGWNIPK